MRRIIAKVLYRPTKTACCCKYCIDSLRAQVCAPHCIRCQVCASRGVAPPSTATPHAASLPEPGMSHTPVRSLLVSPLASRVRCPHTTNPTSAKSAHVAGRSVGRQGARQLAYLCTPAAWPARTHRNDPNPIKQGHAPPLTNRTQRVCTSRRGRETTSDAAAGLDAPCMPRRACRRPRRTWPSWPTRGSPGRSCKSW